MIFTKAQKQQGTGTILRQLLLPVAGLPALPACVFPRLPQQAGLLSDKLFSFILAALPWKEQSKSTKPKRNWTSELRIYEYKWEAASRTAATAAILNVGMKGENNCAALDWSREEPRLTLALRIHKELSKTLP